MIWVSKVMMWNIPLISSHISHHSLSLLTSVLKPASVIWAKQHSVGMIEKTCVNTCTLKAQWWSPFIWYAGVADEGRQPVCHDIHKNLSPQTVHQSDKFSTPLIHDPRYTTHTNTLFELSILSEISPPLSLCLYLTHHCLFVWLAMLLNNFVFIKRGTPDAQSLSRQAQTLQLQQ